MPDLSDDNIHDLASKARARECFRNVIFQELLLALESSGMTRASLSRRLHKRPEQITRWMSSPGNLEIDTISDLLDAMGVSPASIIKSRPRAEATGAAGELLAKMRADEVENSQFVLSPALTDALVNRSAAHQVTKAGLDSKHERSLPAHLVTKRESNSLGVLSRRLAEKRMEFA